MNTDADTDFAPDDGRPVAGSSEAIEKRGTTRAQGGLAPQDEPAQRIRVSDALWGVLAAILFAYPIWQAFAFAFANDDTGWQAVFDGLGWVRWMLLAVGLITPLLLLAASWWISRGQNWWRRLLAYATGWAVIPLIVISAQQAVMSVPQVNDIVLSHLLFGD